MNLPKIIYFKFLNNSSIYGFYGYIMYGLLRLGITARDTKNGTNLQINITFGTITGFKISWLIFHKLWKNQ